MKSAPFDYVAPTSVAETLAVLAEHGDEAKVLAGGQSLVPVLALRLARPSVLVDINRVAELAGVSRDNGTLRIGAATTHADIEHNPELSDAAPLLSRSARFIGHFQIRNRGTFGGSLAHADPAAEWPAVALALDAELEIASSGGGRRTSAAEFFVSTFMTTLEPEELLVAAHLPVWGAHSGFAIEELARRSGDFALAGLVCGVQVADGRIARSALAVLGLASTPVRLSAVEEQLAGASVDGIDLHSIGAGALDGLDPPEDVHASGDYRRRVGAELVTRALARAIEEASSG
jgi:aerobic carbon-monoxide dehydrogenase medium subunit